jgi:deoxyuridine 5'-triphosphate nucleotidohydrolase
MLLIKKLSEYARLPEKAHIGDLGYDLYANESASIYPEVTAIIKTGIAIQFPEGYGGFIKDRSSVATKRGLFTVAGVIDNGYIGEICIALYNGTDSLVHVVPGEKIAQLVLIPTVNFKVTEVDEVVSADQRGEGGFGSTGT